MVEQSRDKILIIDDTIDHLKVLISLLGDSYQVHFARSGEQGLVLMEQIDPDLILLDIVMPGMDGFEVCRRIKRDLRRKNTPVIFISAKEEADDEAAGLNLGAIDYITKPFSPAIVRARIRNHLRLRKAISELEQLYSMALDANPITGLPGNNSIAKQIEQSLFLGSCNCVIYTDIDNFKAFNDKYGFARGDEVIRFIAQVLKNAIKPYGEGECFIGHVGGDDFIVLVPSDHALPFTRDVVAAFDSGILSFYNRQDLEKRCIMAVDRRGEAQVFPIMSVSLAGVDLCHRRYTTYLEVNDACAEMKKIAKATPGSTVYFDQRRES